MLVPKQFACSCVHCRLIKEDEGWRFTTAQVVETSVTVTNNSPILIRTQDYVHPDDQTQPTYILFVLWPHYLSGCWKTWRTQMLCCVSFLVHLLLYLTLHLAGKLPKLSICYLSCWLKWNPPTKYYWTIWHPSCKNLTMQLYKLDSWVVEIKHLSCTIQNCREYRHNEGCIISYFQGYCIRFFGQIWSVSNQV